MGNSRVWDEGWNREGLPREFQAQFFKMKAFPKMILNEEMVLACPHWFIWWWM